MSYYSTPGNTRSLDFEKIQAVKISYYMITLMKVEFQIYWTAYKRQAFFLPFSLSPHRKKLASTLDLMQGNIIGSHQYFTSITSIIRSICAVMWCNALGKKILQFLHKTAHNELCGSLFLNVLRSTSATCTLQTSLQLISTKTEQLTPKTIRLDE